MGDSERAVRDFDRADRGWVKARRNDLDGATTDYSKAIALNPKLQSAYVNRAIAKNRKEDQDGALADCGRALDINPKYALAHVRRGPELHLSNGPRRRSFAGRHSGQAGRWGSMRAAASLGGPADEAGRARCGPERLARVRSWPFDPVARATAGTGAPRASRSMHLAHSRMRPTHDHLARFGSTERVRVCYDFFRRTQQ